MTDSRVRWARTEPVGKEQDDKQEESMHHGGSFRTYMQHKNLKLQEQFEAAQLQQPQLSELFKGVSIHVNGLTVPSHQELKQIMALHGGRFETYYHRNRVTHIICNNLPDTKLKQLAHARDPVPIVKPDWIVASLRAGQLLPTKDFLLQPIRDIPGQRQLFEFKSHAPAALAPAELYPTLQQQQQQQQGQQQLGGQQLGQHAQLGLQGEQQQHQVKERVQQGLAQDVTKEQQRQQQQEWQPKQPQQQQQPHQQLPPSYQQWQQTLQAQGQLALQHQQEQQQVAPQQQQLMPPPPPRQHPQQQQQQHVPRQYQQQQQQSMSPPPPRQQHPGAPPQQQQQQQQQQQAGPPPSSLDAAQATAASLRAACDLLKGPPRSTADDPQGFVGSFFKSSRLHFIGSWKARIEALMADQQQQPAAAAAPPPPKGLLGQQQQQRVGGSAAAAAGARTIVHLDMDCFFAAVAAVGRPEFAGRPLAVCHSNSAQGSGEVSSANYEAREFGIRAGMFMSEAKSRCPELLVVPYEFDKYEEISEQVYRILLRHTPVVMPLSCDEAFLDLTGLTGDPLARVAQIRAEIQAATACTASAGIGPNMLLARLATKSAKPNGQALIAPHQAQQVLGDLAVGELPGVGWSLKSKLADMGITHVRQVWSSSKEVLMRKLGAQTGTSLWQHAHGIDERPVQPPKARRSVGAEVNWGVRFSSDADAATFLKELSREVCGRLVAAGVAAKCVTLKVKRRQAGAPEPAKFLGHGACDNLSRSVTLGRYVSAAGEVYEQAALLLLAMKIPPEEIRGLGITVSKLDSDSSSAAARPSGPAPAKVAPGKQGVFDPSRQPAWFIALQKAAGGQQQQQQQQQHQNKQDQQQQTTTRDGGRDNGQQQQQQQALSAAAGSAGATALGVTPLTPQKRQRPADSTDASAAVAGGSEFVTPGKRRHTAAGSPAAVGSQMTLDGILAQKQHQQQQQQGLLQAQQQQQTEEMQQEQSSAAHPATDPAGVDGAAASWATSPSQDALLMASLLDSTPPETDPAVAAAAVAAAQDGRAAAAAAAAVRGMQGQQDGEDLLVLGSPSARRQLFVGASGTTNHSAAAGSSGVAAAAAAMPAGTPIAALPPMSQLDPEVLAALPLEVRRELEAAYSIQQRQRGSPRGAAHASPGTRAKKQQQLQLQPPAQQRARPAAAAPAAAAPAAAATGAGSSAAAACNWLRAPVAAAAAKRQGKRQQQQHSHPAFVGEKRSRQGSNNNNNNSNSRPQQQQQQQHFSEVLTHMHQIDPEVLAELPPELQQELRAALLGKPQPRAAAAAGDWGGAGYGAADTRGGCLQDNAHARRRQQQQQQVGLSRLWGPAAAGGAAGAAVRSRGGGAGRLGQQQQQLFADEPVNSILAALHATLDVLAPAAAAAAPPPPAAPTGGQTGAAKGSATAAAAAPAVLHNSSGSGSSGEACRKLLVMAEYLVQWMVSHEHDLDGVRRVLQGLQTAGREVVGCGAVAQQVAGVVQQHVQDRFGFRLKLA